MIQRCRSTCQCTLYNTLLGLRTCYAVAWDGTLKLWCFSLLGFSAAAYQGLRPLCYACIATPVVLMWQAMAPTPTASPLVLHTSRCADAVAYEQLPAVDRWLLWRLSAVMTDVTESYESYNVSVSCSTFV